MGPRSDDADEGLPSEVLLVPPPVRPRRVPLGLPPAPEPTSDAADQAAAEGWVVQDAGAPTEEPGLPRASDPEVLGPHATADELDEELGELPSLVPDQAAPPMIPGDLFADTPGWRTPAVPPAQKNSYTVPLFGLAPPRVADPEHPPVQEPEPPSQAVWIVAFIALLVTVATALALLLL